MDFYIFICTIVGIAAVSLLVGGIVLVLITNLIFLVHRSFSFWWLTMRADKFHNGKVVKDSYKKRWFYKTRLLLRILIREGPKLMLFRNDDSLYNEYLYWSIGKKYVKGKLVKWT